jgi:hypothetical protein
MHMILIIIVLIFAMIGFDSVISAFIIRSGKRAVRNYYQDRMIADYLSRKQ